MADGASRGLAELWDETGNHRAALLDVVEHIAGGGTWVWDVARDRVVWSVGLFRLLGHDPERYEATVEGFYAALHPDDRERVRAQSQANAKSGNTETVHCRIVRPDREVRHVRLDGLAVHDAQGTLLRLIGTVVDTTESRAREAELARSAALLAEAQRIARVGSWYWEPATGRAEWSDELFRILDVPREDGPSKEGWLSRVHPDDLARARLIRERVASLLHDGPAELRLLLPNGVERTVVVEASPYDPHEPARGVVGVVLDITERKQLEEGLRLAQKMEALGQLSGGIAHDFNNLLAVIQSTAELLRKRGVPELDIVLQATERGAALTRQLLAFSRRDVVRVTAVPLNETVSSAARLLGRVLGEDVRVALELGPALWDVRGDRGQLEQVVMNLAINARDAMPGGGDLTIRTGNLARGATCPVHGAYAEESDVVLLAVTDTGAGMTAETRARMFEPFFTTKPIGRGTGLGLATVFGIVTRSGGKIAVDTELGKGTTVTLYFPRATERPSARPPPASLSARPSQNGERVLLVEDDDGVRSVMRKILENAGYRVDEACDPERAWAIAVQAEPFDLLLTDVVMPGTSGRSLARKLVTAGRARSVLYVTGYAPDSTTEDDLAQAAYLSKPFLHDELLSAVRGALITL